MRRLALVALAGIAAAACVQPPSSETKSETKDGPFGIYEGMTLQELKKVDPAAILLPKSSLYMVTTVPAPSSKFTSYTVVLAPSTGACAVMAMTDDITADSQGFEVKRRFESILDLLKSVYGEPKRYDFLGAGSIWKDPQDWMMGLARKERTLSAAWTPKDDPKRVSSIALWVAADSSTEGRVLLKYEFTNFGACTKEREAEQKSVL